MSTTRIMHVIKPGHRCHNPFPRNSTLGTAANIKAGEICVYGGWQIMYYPQIKAYAVQPENKPQPFYEFTNFNCAAAKLGEMGFRI